MAPREQLEALDKNPHILQPPKNDTRTTYCQEQTQAFIVITLNAVNPRVSTYLDACLEAIQSDIDSGRTGPIPSHGWRGPLGRGGLYMVVWSEDGYQTTYEVLHSAIQEIIAWMSSSGHTFGTCGFTIWYGAQQVGHGSVNG